MNPDTLDAIAPLAEPVVPKRIPSPDAALRLSSLSPRRVNAAAIPEAPVPAGVPTDAAFERDYGNSWKPKAVREAEAAAPIVRTPEMEADFQRSKAIPAPIKPDAKFSTFEEFIDRLHGVTPVVRYGMDTGRRANKPTMGTEIGSRRPELGFGSPVVEQDGKLVDWQPPTGFASKSWQALRNGLVTTQDSLNGMVGIGAGLLGAKSMVERTADYARWVTEDMALNEVKGDNWFTQGYYDALGAAPNMALQIALAAATKSPAGFIIGGAGTAAGGQFNESVNAYRDAGQSMEDATANALVDSAISGAVTGVTNILPGKVLMGGKAKAAIANAVGMARLKQIGLMGLKGAGAEAAQEFSEQAGTDFLVALRRLNKPEFDQFYAENPKWASDILSGALRSAVAGAMLGGAAGASIPTAQMTADKFFRPDTKGLRGAADAVAMTPEQADAAAAALSATAEKVDAASKDDADFQRRVAPALDLTGFTDDQLADIVLKGNSGETAPLNGGLLPDRPFTVNPIIAGEELKRRKSGGPVKAAGGGLKINEDGSTSPGAVAAWTARNPALSAEMRAKDGLSRADLDRIVGRSFGANSMLVRQKLHKEIVSTEPDGVTAAREIVEELTGLPPERAALVARGLSPKTAAQEPVVKYADPMAADIAALNGVDPETITVREANTDAERRAAKFGESRGITVRFFDSKEGVATRGASRGASMYLNSGLSSENQLVSVAVHEALDLLHSGDPDGWRRMFGVVEDKAPKALDALRRSYEAKFQQQAEDTGSDDALGAMDIEREGMSNLAEALVRAFDLHLAVDGKGGFDKAKARELVGYDPSFFARLVDAVRRALGAVGIRLKGMNKGQADRIAQFMGREPHELSSPAVRGFIADQLGNALNAIHAEGGAKASQSIGDAPLGGRNAKVDRDEFLARRYNPTASLGRFADVLYRETSLERAFELIDRNADGQDLSRTEFFMAESPEMALGQDENKGVMIAFDAAPLNGQVNRGKALAEQAFLRGDGEFVALGNSRESYRDAVRSVTVKKGATGQPWMVRRMKAVLDKLAKDGWTKTSNADGSETYSRPDAVRGVSQSIGESSKPKRDREAVALAREAKERAAASRTANTNKVWSNLRARIASVERRGEQSRIDLAHRIGRREGLMSGEVEGQRKGRREGAKATKAEYRQLLSDAEQAIAVLPVPWQGKFRSRLAKATTKTRVLRLAEKVAEALAMSTVQDARKRAFAQQRRLRKRGMNAETKALVESMNAEAIELLSGEGGRMIPYTSMADLASRVATASEAMAEARALADADRASFKAAKADRAVANKAAAAALVESLKAVPSTEEPTDITKARKMGVMGRIWRQNADMHTVVERIEGVSGGALTDAWSSLESGENAKTQAVASVKERWDDRIKRLGFKDREDFDRRAQGGYGEASAIMLPVRLGGREVRIPLGKAMALAAIDKSTEARIVKAGFSWKDDPDAAAIIPTTHELNILRRRLGSKNMAMVEGVKNDLAAAMEDQYFAAHHRLNGKTAKKEEGYFPTVRHGDPNPDEMPLDASPSKIASGMFRQQTNQIERVNSDRKFLFGDFMQTMERQADDMARFIHQAEATRRAVTLLTDKRVADELKRAFGSDMKERLVEHVLHGVGLGKHTQLSSADKAISSISGNFLLLNYETWLRQLGGIARAGTEMPAGALAVGAAQAAALNGSPKARAELVRKVMRANGFALARWTQSMVGVQTGFEGGAKADKARFVAAMKAVGDSMREAVGDARSLQLRQAAKRVGSAGWNAARMLRSMESALRFVDQQVFLSAMLGHAHAIKAATPSIGEDALFQQAVRMAERTFRRTQNSSSRLDDTLMQSRAKQRQSAARLMFPFSTDTLKAWNQLSRAYRSGSKRDMARAASAVAVNNLWSAAINPAIGLGALAVGLALTDGQDDETLTQQAMDDAAVKFGRKAATDALGPVAGYAGIVSSYIADAALRSRNPDVGDNIIPIRVMNDLGAGVVDLVKTGDPVPVAKAAAMTLTPVGVPVAKAATLHAQATPGIEEVAKALRKRQAANDLTLAQHRRLQQVEAQIERERAERIKAGTQTAKDREWMAEQKAAKEGKARQAEKFRTEAEKLRSGK